MIHTFSQSRFFLLQSTVDRSIRGDFHSSDSSLSRSAPIAPSARNTTACEEILSCRSSRALRSPFFTFVQDGMALATCVQNSTATPTISACEGSLLTRTFLSSSSLASYNAERLNSFGERTGRDK